MRPAHALLLVALLAPGGCQWSLQPQTKSPPCEATFLALEGSNKVGGVVAAFEVSPSSRVPLASVSVPSGFRIFRLVWLGAHRVALSAQDERVTEYFVWVVDFANGRRIELTRGRGVAPYLGALQGNRLVLGWLGRNVVTPVDAWSPTEFGDATWQVVDGLDDAVLVRVGLGPRADAYLIAVISGAGVQSSKLVLDAGDVLLSPTALDHGSRAALYATASPDAATLWRTSAIGAKLILGAPGRPVTYGGSDRFVALAVQGADNATRVLVGERGRQPTEVILPQSQHVTGGSAIFAGSDLAVALGTTDGEFLAHFIPASRNGSRGLGNVLPIAPLNICS